MLVNPQGSGRYSLLQVVVAQCKQRRQFRQKFNSRQAAVATVSNFQDRPQKSALGRQGHLASRSQWIELLCTERGFLWWRINSLNGYSAIHLSKALVPLQSWNDAHAYPLCRTKLAYCHYEGAHPHLSLRGAQRRGNLDEAEHTSANRRCYGAEIATLRSQ